MNDVCNNFNLHRKSIRREDTIANVSKNHRILVSYQQTVSANPYGIFHRKYFKKYYISGRIRHKYRRARLTILYDTYNVSDSGLLGLKIKFL